eukprot:scaffold86732_cov78-Phaeocystis_antarctica.AAC.1
MRRSYLCKPIGRVGLVGRALVTRHKDGDLPYEAHTKLTGRHALAPEEGEAHQDEEHLSAQWARRPLRAGVRRRRGS